MYSGNDLKKETLIELEGVPYKVVEYSHHAMGRGGGVVRTKLKNLVNGSVLERTFRPTDKVPAAEVERKQWQFLYREGSSLVFMDQETYEQETVDLAVVGDNLANYIAEGSPVGLFYFKDKIIGVDMPNNVVLQVTHTEPGVKGDTATSAFKPATLETGVTVNVPLFINEGDKVKVDTRTGQYLERQK
jgi:elongation factor P